MRTFKTAIYSVFLFVKQCVKPTDFGRFSLSLQADFKLLDMHKYEQQNLREAMLLHKEVSRQLADYCQAAAHVLRMSQPKVCTNSSSFPDAVRVCHSYQTLRLLASSCAMQPSQPLVCSLIVAFLTSFVVIVVSALDSTLIL